MQTFDLYFATILGMQYHPGSGTRGHVPLSIEECAEIAYGATILASKYKEKLQCLSSQLE